MRLWTVQNEAVMSDIEHNGVYTVDVKNAAPIYFKNEGEEYDIGFYMSYGWISNQLAKKTPRPDNVKYPIWAWKMYSQEHERPDMRSWTTTEPEKVVRLTLEVPDEEVLLSNFSLWHIPLNLGYLAYSRTEDDQFDAWLEENGIDPIHNDIWHFDCQDKTIVHARRKIFKSWERIFDFDPSHWDLDWSGELESDPIQAVFWQLKNDYIKKVEYFTTRKAGQYL